MIKLNLGCGRQILEGYINVDYINAKGVDLVLDLEKIPFPFKESECDEILMISIFEHLNNPIEVLKELHRITKPNKLIVIEVPHFSSNHVWIDLTHKRAFSYGVFNNYDINFKQSNSLEQDKNLKFKVEKHFRVSKVFSIFGIGLLANRFPYVYERFFAHLFPTGNIVFKLYPVKDFKKEVSE